MTYLCHVHIGPVQSFIAAGRRTQDLYVGSWLLSELARAGVEAAHQAHADLLYPTLDNGKMPDSVPNLFMFLTNDADARGICEYVEQTVRARWNEIAHSVKSWLTRQIGGGAWETQFDAQIKQWLELYWVAVPYDDTKHQDGFAAVKRAMAARKNARHFPQVEEPGIKCTVTGAASALNITWETLQTRVGEIELRPNEKLGALALIKRFAQKARVMADQTNFPSTSDIAGLDGKVESQPQAKELEGYYAILLMDGDQMGAKLSHLKTQQAHQQFSNALVDFADHKVLQIIERYDAEAQRDDKKGRAALVYAGGDDVLALLPLRFVLACADDIRKAYSDMMEHDGGIPNATMSAGIAIVPTNYPLDAALEIARSAEKHAKNDYGRNAVVVIEAHGTGQQREAGAQWDTEGIAVIRVMADLQAAFTPPAWLSAKLGYDLQDLAYRLVGHNVPAEARAAELKRVIKQRSMSFHDNKDDARVPIDEFAEALAALGESPYCGWQSLANWVILTRFLATGGRDS